MCACLAGDHVCPCPAVKELVLPKRACVCVVPKIVEKGVLCVCVSRQTEPTTITVNNVPTLTSTVAVDVQVLDWQTHTHTGGQTEGGRGGEDLLFSQGKERCQ